MTQENKFKTEDIVRFVGEPQHVKFDGNKQIDRIEDWGSPWKYHLEGDDKHLYYREEELVLVYRAPEPDMVNEPPHYKMGGIETIDIIKAKTTSAEYSGFLIGNILKYVTRHGHKNGIEDLKKAQYYLNKLIEEKEGEA